MNKIIIYFSMATLFALISCSGRQPDLIISYHEASWTADTKQTYAEIRNVGDTIASNFYIMLDFKEDPVSNADLEPVRYGPYNLDFRDTIKIRFDAMPFARAENNYLNDVNLIYLMVDHGYNVTERDENNNINLYRIR